MKATRPCSTPAVPTRVFIATNILAARLKALEENELIEKLEHPESKTKLLYRLTAKGIDLLPIMI